jgi:hypothetical protein
MLPREDVMKKVLVHSPTTDTGRIVSSLSGYELVQTRSRLELTEAIVSSAPILCLIVSQERLSPEMREYLSSLKRSFPVLEVCVVTPGEEPALPAGYRHIDGALEASRLRAAVASFVAAVSSVDRREHRRYDWPLQGYLSPDKQQWQPYPVRALSSGGAFLECARNCPNPGSRTFIRIVFQDHALSAACEILPTRAASSNLPPGFGIRFLELGMLARGIIERIVHDSLTHSLLEPEEEPQMPSLSDEDLLEAGFEEL